MLLVLILACGGPPSQEDSTDTTAPYETADCTVACDFIFDHCEVRSNLCGFDAGDGPADCTPGCPECIQALENCDFSVCEEACPGVEYYSQSQ